MKYSRMVAVYLAEFASHEQEWLDHYTSLESLSEAIRQAALARGPGGKKFSHQWRLPDGVLGSAASALLAAQGRIRSCKSFDELHNLVAATAGEIPGFGQLATYDTALRIGARLGLWPRKVYLHAGTRDGYLALGGDRRARIVDKAALPQALQTLKPHQIEDLLCICKGSFDAAKGGRIVRSCFKPAVRAKC